MKNLTIKRNKSFVGCLTKLKVYIEDPERGELTIGGTPCRKLGELKNGEEKTFQVEEGALKVYVIADKLSKNYCSELFLLPEGGGDVFLSGRSRFDPATGNAFRFDGNEDEAALANRRQGSRRGIMVLSAALILGLVTGFFISHALRTSRASKAKTFSSSGMSIVLTNEFKEMEIEGQTVAFGSKNAAVLALKEPFTLLDGFEDMSLEQYADMVIEANGLDNAQSISDGELVGFEYDAVNPETNDTFRYRSYVYKTADSFWLVQFAAKKSDAEKYSEKFAQWARSLSFSS